MRSRKSKFIKRILWKYRSLRNDHRKVFSDDFEKYFNDTIEASSLSPPESYSTATIWVRSIFLFLGILLLLSLPYFLNLHVAVIENSLVNRIYRFVPSISFAAGIFALATALYYWIRRYLPGYMKIFAVGIIWLMVVEYLGSIYAMSLETNYRIVHFLYPQFLAIYALTVRSFYYKPSKDFTQFFLAFYLTCWWTEVLIINRSLDLPPTTSFLISYLSVVYVSLRSLVKVRINRQHPILYLTVGMLIYWSGKLPLEFIPYTEFFDPEKAIAFFPLVITSNIAGILANVMFCVAFYIASSNKTHNE